VHLKKTRVQRRDFFMAKPATVNIHSANAAVSALSRWLICVALLILITVTVGGITRLTESGLSITEWKPLSGIIPPLSDSDWQAEFGHYKQIDQYAAIHAAMTLDQFKNIFFWEYLHRMLGRIVGLSIVLPLMWFAAKRAIPRGFGAPLLAIVALVGLQGTLGWLMVKSGLQPGMTKVAPAWLGAHLMTALTTLSVLVWTLLNLKAWGQGQGAARITRFSALVLAALFVQLYYGALMAGLRAGHVAADWPLMQGKLYPAGVDWSQGVGAALLADPYLVHFIHRWWAWVVAALLIIMARHLRRIGNRPASIAIHSIFGIQLLLGIATVMSGVALWLAVLHQLVGALLTIAAVWGAHALGLSRDKIKQSGLTEQQWAVSKAM
jgi:heme a synthase